ncbi:MAG TPA: hypothetical protein PKL56_19825 [Cyclobacteriaceae bacterium]|nr:hypothetical protein [Cyclobacteriaceae bacterium]HMV10462.1 hypothetical protein [Cyclobacteriaceae bacterium]HMX01386.1 hypothetical protein [Cyclobacteriaceae bacterium]HMX50344.1 hypothetical protein [Cyclobacteriaceae bacterium]HMY92412.1 hypothetical protein [Cyclobacteriaceae bacterium]
MSVKILDITKVSPASYQYFFFDANIWITNLLNVSGKLPQVPRPQSTKYCHFFSEVVKLATRPPITQKTVPPVRPKIVVTSLLVSELFNAYMHLMFDVYKKTDPACTVFKKHYRGSDDYEKQMRILASDFEAFREYVHIESDYIQEIDPYTIFQCVSPVNDFNDLYSYYQMIEVQKTRNPIAIVTDDADFVFSGIDIITANSTLLNLNKKGS